MANFGSSKNFPEKLFLDHDEIVTMKAEKKRSL
jgi:hypothetical protein